MFFNLRKHFFFFLFLGIITLADFVRYFIIRFYLSREFRLKCTKQTRSFFFLRRPFYDTGCDIVYEMTKKEIEYFIIYLK